MRLTPHETRAIRACAARHFGEGAKVRVFGSRVDDTRRGGDIDLHVEAETPELASLANELHFLDELKSLIGDQKVDLVVRPPRYSPRAIDLIAIQTGIELGLDPLSAEQAGA
jgi:predicted nucleotidyltransferase